MTVTLLQSTTDWVFYIINIATFLFCGISTIFRQDFDGASNESVTAMLYEWDRNGKIPKKKRKSIVSRPVFLKTMKPLRVKPIMSGMSMKLNKLHTFFNYN